MYFGKVTDLPRTQDSDTNLDTTASSVAGDIFQGDGRRRRSEATQLRKTILGNKQSRLDESKVREMIGFRALCLMLHLVLTNHHH